MKRQITPEEESRRLCRMQEESSLLFLFSLSILYFSIQTWNYFLFHSRTECTKKMKKKIHRHFSSFPTESSNYYFFLSYFHLFCWARARVRHLRIVWSEKSDWRVFNSAAAEPPVRENEVEVNFLLRWALSWARAKMLQPSKRAVKKQKQKKKALNVFFSSFLSFHRCWESLWISPENGWKKNTQQFQAFNLLSFRSAPLVRSITAAAPPIIFDSCVRKLLIPSLTYALEEMSIVRLVVDGKIGFSSTSLCWGSIVRQLVWKTKVNLNISNIFLRVKIAMLFKLHFKWAISTYTQHSSVCRFRRDRR